MHEIDAALAAMADPVYRDFQSRLLPTVDPARILGVRVPALRRYARTLAGTPAAEAFLAVLPHAGYDADMLHAILLSGMRDRAALIDALDRFLPHVDNWAVCDALRPRILGRDIPALRRDAERWMADTHLYACRFGVEMLMVYAMGDEFDAADLEAVAAVAWTRGDAYYLSMICAWYFATALACYPAETMPYFAEPRLPRDTLQRAIRKACESYRIPDATKAALRSLRAKFG